VLRWRARLLLTLAYSKFELHGQDRSRESVAAALLAAQESGTPEVVALAHDLRGHILLRGGDLPGSLVEFDLAVALGEHLAERERGSLLLNRGTVQLFRRDLTAARTDLARSIELSSATGDGQVEFKARHNLGYAEFLAGDLPRALDTMARADALDVPVSRSVWLLDRARVLMEAGLLVDAETSLASAASLLAAERAGHDLAETQLERAQLALLQGNWQAASAYAGRAKRDFTRRGSAGWAARADVTRWQAELDSPRGAARVVREVTARGIGTPPGPSDSGDHPSPADRATRPVAERPDPKSLLLAAEAHVRLGRVAEAGDLLEQVARGSADDPLSSRLHQHLVRAQVATAAHDQATARRELRSGLTTLTRAQARHHSLDLRTAMAVHGGRLAELDLRLALASGSESGSGSGVFDSLERWRAMSHRRTAVTPPEDPTLAELLTALRLVAEDLRGAPPGAPVDPLRRRQRRLQQEVREREWQISGEGRSRPEARLREVRPVLAATGNDLVAHFVLDSQLFAVTVKGRRRCTVEVLASWRDVEELLYRVLADLDALSGPHLPAPLRAAVATSLRRDLRRLEALVLPTVVAESPGLVVVPTRSLATVPWTLLPGRRGRPTTVALSATSWLHGSVASTDDRRQRGARLHVSAVAGPGLPLAPIEVRDVADAWATAGADATAVPPEQGVAATLIDALVGSDLVHIAAHGSHNRDNPLFSSLRLTGGPLFAYDVPQDTTIARHVVLSSCDVGLVTPRPGDEVLGLTAALLGLGPTCVVSAVSRVEDVTAHATMLRYHQALIAGVDSASALANAVGGGAEADHDGLEHPAPFVCFGWAWTAPAVAHQ